MNQINLKKRKRKKKHQSRFALINDEQASISLASLSSMMSERASVALCSQS
jgi:hypothetical protein